MTLDELRARVHYQPAGLTAVCGFKAEVMKDAEINAAVLHPLLRVRTTTDVRSVTCGKCGQWLIAACGAMLNRCE